jgi:hypothetical protein
MKRSTRELKLLGSFGSFIMNLYFNQNFSLFSKFQHYSGVGGVILIRRQLTRHASLARRALNQCLFLGYQSARLNQIIVESIFNILGWLEYKIP